MEMVYDLVFYYLHNYLVLYFNNLNPLGITYFNFRN